MRTRGLRRQFEVGLGTACPALAALALGVSSLSLACAHHPASASAPGSSPAAHLPGGSPFAGIPIYRAPYSNAENAQRRLEKTNPGDAALVAKIAAQPQASWYGGWSGDIQTVVSNYVNAAERAGALALLVAYNVPNRDCGQYSAGGAADGATYLEWIKGFAAGIGQRRAVVVLEPDALALLAQCLSPEDQQKRLDLIHQAVLTLKRQPGVAVYIDAGHSHWVPAPDMADRLKRAGVADARGFALNTSNYRADDELQKFAKDLLIGLQLDAHFVIDSSRNGNGPAPAEDPEAWCNPEGRALGRAPTTDTGDPAQDAFLWLKRPGESDGECKGGPGAGQWFEARALEMARNAKW
ncbi:MAG: glycoside hydrolase family 6 protein [Deltaproteobacteria bacterium]